MKGPNNVCFVYFFISLYKRPQQRLPIMSTNTISHHQNTLEKRIKPILDRIHRVRDLLNRATYEEKYGFPVDDVKALQFKELPAIQSNLNPECLRKNMKPILFLIGGPGSKSKSLAKMIEHKYDFSLISVGDILRDEIKSGSPLGLFIAATVRNGELVRSDIVVWLLKREVLNRFGCSTGLVIEGFPRTQEQLVRFEKEVARAHIAFVCRIEYAALEDMLLYLRGEKRDDLRYRIYIYRKYTAPIVNDFGKRGKVIYGDGRAAWRLLDHHLAQMLLEWCFLKEDVTGLEDLHCGEKVKICYPRIPEFQARGEQSVKLGARMFEILGGIIPYFVQLNCERGTLGHPELGLY